MGGLKKTLDNNCPYDILITEGINQPVLTKDRNHDRQGIKQSTNKGTGQGD
jgi:hypothetical protein